MPTTSIDYTGAYKALNSDPKTLPDGSCFVLTPYGLSIIEIQGELNLPASAPSADTSADIDPEYMANFAKVDSVYDAIKFGRMVFDEKDQKKVVLFIGKLQRLLGVVESLREPLGVLKVPQRSLEDEDTTEGGIEMIDIIDKKIIFRQRPLPIM